MINPPIAGEATVSIALLAKMFRDGCAKLFRLARMLQHQRALQIDRAVQTAGQNKVAFEQAPRFFKFLNYFF